MEKQEGKEQTSYDICALLDDNHAAKRGPTTKNEQYERIAEVIFSSIITRQIDQSWIDEQTARGEYWCHVANAVFNSSKLKSRIGLHLMWKNNRGDIRTKVTQKAVVATKQSCWDADLTVATRKNRARKRLSDQFVTSDITTGKTGKFDSSAACMVCKKLENEDSTGTKWISCSACSGWFHFRCIGIDGENEEIFANQNLAKKIVFHCATKNCSMDTFCCKYSYRGRTINLPMNMMRSTNLERQMTHQ